MCRSTIPPAHCLVLAGSYTSLTESESPAIARWLFDRRGSNRLLPREEVAEWLKGSDVTVWNEYRHWALESQTGRPSATASENKAQEE
jgi:glutathione S-transferase